SRASRAQGRTMGLFEIMELATTVRPTCDFMNPTILIQLIEAGVRIGLQRAPKPPQMLQGVFSSAIRRVRKPNCRSRRVACRSVIANIGPQPSRFRLASAGRQHRYPRVVGM